MEDVLTTYELPYDADYPQVCLDEKLVTLHADVVDRAVAGETNRDIAQALFVTPKTVEVHLSNAYRKLGIRSRREPAAALAAG